MNHLHQHDAGRAPARPAGIVEARIVFDGAVEPARSELFLPGTEEARVSLARTAATRPRIAYPGNGSIIAIDPDIPATRQRVRFAAGPGAGPVTWLLNGQSLGNGSAFLWQPLPGRHALLLADAGGAQIDRVTFEVRGALPPGGAGVRGN